MPSQKKRPELVATAIGLAALTLAGCSTVGGATSDLGLAGAGGVAGYHLSGGKVGGAAAGAAVGYVASRAAQSEVKSATTEAEKRGYDRAMNQAVKQQYWIIQDQQKSRATTEESEAKLIPIVVPETEINGVLVKAHVEYIRLEP